MKVNKVSQINLVNVSNEYIKECSENNLKFLAKELAQNYCSISLPIKKMSQPFDDKILNVSKFTEHYSRNYRRLISKEINDGKITSEQQTSEIFEGYELTRELHNLKANNEDYFHKRTVVIIGAGATHNAFKSIPLGGQAVKKLFKSIELLKIDKTKKITFLDVFDLAVNEEDFDKTNKGVRELIDENDFLTEIVKRIKEERYKLRLYEENDSTKKYPVFEESLRLASEFITDDTLRKRIKELFKAKHGPTLFYNIIAHMLKHRIIDVVINFNFDELLDQCIEDHIGQGNYQTVINARDCEKLKNILKGDRIKEHERLMYPVYIKPHGTMSDKDSLRFTKNHYYEIPSEVLQLMDDLISSRLQNNKEGSREKNHEEPRKSINFISVGYEMESLEFNEILKNASLPKKSNFFWFFHHNEKEDKKNPDKPKFFARDQIDKYVRTFHEIFNNNEFYSKEEINENNIELFFIGHEFEIGKTNPLISSDNSPSLGKVFYGLFDEFSDFFNSPFKPVSLKKHLIEEALIGNTQFWKNACTSNEKVEGAYPQTYFESSQYFADRLVLESIMVTLKTLGKVDPYRFLLMNLGKYYEQYFNIKIKEEEKEKKDPKKRRKPIRLSEFLSIFPISDKYRKEGKKKVEEFRPFMVTEIDKEKHKDILEHFLGINSGKSKITKYVSKHFASNLNEIYKAEENRTILKSYLKSIFQSNLSNIKSKYLRTGYYMFDKFSSSDLLPTNLSIQYYYYKKLTEKFKSGKKRGQYKVNTLYLVAERGYYLKKFIEYCDVEERKDLVIYLIVANNHIFDSGGSKKWKWHNIESDESSVEDCEVLCKRKKGSKMFQDSGEEEEVSLEGRIRQKLFEDFKPKNQDDCKVGNPQYDKYLKNLNNKNLNILFLDTYGHNHHMTVFANIKVSEKDGQKTFELSKTRGHNLGIYYYQPGLSYEVNPIKVELYKNIDYLISKFCQYHTRASSYSDSQSEQLSLEYDYHNKEMSEKILDSKSN